MAPRTKKSVTTPEETVVAVETAPVVETPVVSTDDAVSPVEDVDTVDQFSVVVEKLQAMQTELKTLLVTVKNLQKENAKLKKLTQKKKKSKGCPLSGGCGARPQSGFSKPTKISDALCEFFGIARGSELARTEVTKRITAYVKANKLQDPSDKRKINPDAKLKSVLDIPVGVQLSFFNLQSCVKSHFLKA